MDQDPAVTGYFYRSGYWIRGCCFCTPRSCDFRADRKQRMPFGLSLADRSEGTRSSPRRSAAWVRAVVPYILVRVAVTTIARWTVGDAARGIGCS